MDLDEGARRGALAAAGVSSNVPVEPLVTMLRDVVRDVGGGDVAAQHARTKVQERAPDGARAGDRDGRRGVGAQVRHLHVQPPRAAQLADDHVTARLTFPVPPIQVQPPRAAQLAVDQVLRRLRPPRQGALLPRQVHTREAPHGRLPARGRLPAHRPVRLPAQVLGEAPLDDHVTAHLIT